MKVFSQNRHCPSQVLFAFDEVATSSIEEIKWAVAYATYRGCERLINRVAFQVGEQQWSTISKRFIVSLDFGLTDPEALLFLDNLQNSTVFIANPAVVDKADFYPENAFHPKLYLFNSHHRTNYLVGSANLTESALISNTEIVVIGNEIPQNGEWEAVWANALIDSEPLSPILLEIYRQRRVTRRLRNINPDPDIPVPTIQPQQNAILWNAISNHEIFPSNYRHFWIEAGSMSSGGSHNQLELPRGANQFFGFAYSNYEHNHVTIGHPVLAIRGNTWNDRPLTWHGNNRMERINLPTIQQGGFAYENCAILFRKDENGFEIKVASWNDATALAWRSASEALNTVFRLGSKGQRICGFF